jgi:hypothetical protein
MQQMQDLLEGRLDGCFIGARPKPLPRGVEAVVWKQEDLLLVFPQEAVFSLALKVVADGWRPCHKAGPGVQAKTNHPL